jgi:hypothetical protein
MSYNRCAGLCSVPLLLTHSFVLYMLSFHKVTPDNGCF